MATYITITYKMSDSNTNNGVSEILEQSADYSYATMVEYRTSKSYTNLDNTLCGTEFSPEEVTKLKKLLKRDISELIPENPVQALPVIEEDKKKRI